MDTIISQPAVASAAAPQKGPSAQDWERLYPVLKQLYSIDDKPLKEVMDIMAREHGHRATVRMYKRRITNFGLDKKHKECDMRAILRKKTQRDAIGKSSAFGVRGRPVEIEEVLYYFKRKGITESQIMSALDDEHAPTPPAVTCWTPPLSPMPECFPSIENMDMNGVETLFSGVGNPHLVENSPGRMYENGSSPANMPAYVSIQEIRRILSLSPEPQPLMMPQQTKLLKEIPRSPSPPRIFLEHEKLFFSIKVYFTSFFESGVFVTDKDGWLINSKHSMVSSYDVNDFEELCLTAIDVIERGLFVQGRQLLSKACGLLEDVLRAEHPRTLDILLQLIYLLIPRLPKAAGLLRTYIGSLAEIYVNKVHPWGQILSFLGTVDEDELNETISQIWQYNLDVFKKGTGKFHLSYQECYMRYVRQTKDAAMATQLCHVLLKEMEQRFESYDNRITRLRLEYAIMLYCHCKYREALSITSDILGHCQRTYNDVWINALLLSAYCHKDLGGKEQAEEQLREAISETKNVFGDFDPSTLDRMFKLERWLVEWGRDAEARELRAKIEEHLGEDEIDEL